MTTKKDEDILDKFNKSLGQLNIDMVRAIDDYFKRGDANILMIIGMLQSHIHHLNVMGVQTNLRDSENKDLSKVNYIG